MDLRHLQQLSTPVWIFDVARHGIWWANKQGIAFWKAASLDELRARDFSSDSATVRERLRQIVEGAIFDTHITDTWTLYPAGHPLTVILSFQPVEIEDGIHGILIELVQVVDRDADDETWRLLEAARATSLIMTTFTMDGEVLAQNPAALACYDGASVHGDGLSDLEGRFVHQQDAQQVLANAASNETANWEADVLTAKGRRTHSISVRKGRDPITGDFVTVISEEDVTERAALRKMQEHEKEALKHKVAESSDKLRISQQRYQLAAEAAAIWDWDIVEDRLFISPNFIKALGYAEAEFKSALRENRLEGVAHPDDVEDYKRALAEHLAAPESHISHEMRFLTMTGDVRWFHCQGKCVVDRAGRPTRSVGLLTDITKRKQLEDTLLVTQRLEAIGQLTGGIAHDFNNLLTIIQGNAELLEELEVTDRELTREIVRAVQRGADLTTHLLAFARQQTLIPKPVDLNRLIPEMEKTLFRAISETVTIEYQGDAELWHIHADPTQLETAILNLALNGRDAMPDGGTLSIRATNKRLSDIQQADELELSAPEYVEISVTDTGKGMNPDTLRKAFEPFFTTKGVGQGSGLGLSMVLGFSRQSKGDARIATQSGAGTTVSFYLPRAEAPVERVAARPKTNVRFGNREHVHILEDNQRVQETVSKLVGSFGYDVTTSNDVSEAINWSQQNPQANLYLVDILLPGGKSGLDFVRQLKERQPHAKVLFMSGFAENDLVESSGLMQEYGLVSKPFDKNVLSQAIGAALNGQEVPQ